MSLQCPNCEKELGLSLKLVEEEEEAVDTGEATPEQEKAAKEFAEKTP